MTEFKRGELVLFVSDSIIVMFQVGRTTADTIVHAISGSAISCSRYKETLSADNWEYYDGYIFPREKVRAVTENWMRMYTRVFLLYNKWYIRVWAYGRNPVRLFLCEGYKGNFSRG